MKIMDENKENKCERSVEERMPKLSQEHMVLAANEDSKKWADWLIEHYNIGDIHNEGNGVTLQIVSEQKVRCIRLYDDPGAWYCLSVTQETFKCANIEFEIDPIVIITPMGKRVLGAKDKAEKDMVSGLDKSENPSRAKEATQASLDAYGMEVA
jgi:hypothetical protein